MEAPQAAEPPDPAVPNPVMSSSQDVALQDVSRSAGKKDGLHGPDNEDDNHSHELHAHFHLPPGEPKHDAPVVDIEHVPVENDPREWSNTKKTLVLYMVSIASLAPTLGASIYNPAFGQLEEQLGATQTQLALSVSLFILFQGGWPVFWSSIAEVTGRKIIYLSSFALFIVGTTIAGRSNSMVLLILMRLVQAFGSSAVLSVGAGSLADMYERHERGSKMGVSGRSVSVLRSRLELIAFVVVAVLWRTASRSIAGSSDRRHSHQRTSFFRCFLQTFAANVDPAVFRLAINFLLDRRLWWRVLCGIHLFPRFLEKGTIAIISSGSQAIPSSFSSSPGAR